MLTDIQRYARNTQMADIQPFIIDIPATDITELQNRLNATRWPDPETPDDWSQGVMEPSPEGKAGCEYVVGGPDQADWFYCGHPRQDRSVYCENHHSLCYTRRRRKATA